MQEGVAHHAAEQHECGNDEQADDERAQSRLDWPGGVGNAAATPDADLSIAGHQLAAAGALQHDFGEVGEGTGFPTSQYGERTPPVARSNANPGVTVPVRHEVRRANAGVRRAVLRQTIGTTSHFTRTRTRELSPHRTFRDDAARLWNAWDVRPAWGERRARERRLREGSPSPAMNERRRHERRLERGLRVSLPPRLAGGWIAFECGDERRRVAPIPDGWSELDEPALRKLWATAEDLPPRRKRLVE